MDQQIQLLINNYIDQRIQAALTARLATDPQLLAALDERIAAHVQDALRTAFGGLGVSSSPSTDAPSTADTRDFMDAAPAYTNVLISDQDAAAIEAALARPPIALVPTPEAAGTTGAVDTTSADATRAAAVTPPRQRPNGLRVLKPAGAQQAADAEVDAQGDNPMPSVPVWHEPIPQTIPGRAGRKPWPLADCAPATRAGKLREINAERVRLNLPPYTDVEQAIRAQAASGYTERLRAARQASTGSGTPARRGRRPNAPAAQPGGSAEAQPVSSTATPPQAEPRAEPQAEMTSAAPTPALAPDAGPLEPAPQVTTAAEIIPADILAELPLRDVPPVAPEFGDFL